MKCICRFACCKTDNSNFDNMLYKAAPIDKSVLADTVNMYLCEVTQHIPVLDEGKLNVYRDNLPPMASEYIHLYSPYNGSTHSLTAHCCA